jgi:spermidine/putrescine transport system substrate-binding protein
VKSRPRNSSRATARAARLFTRRTVLKEAAALGTVAGVGPWIVGDAFSSSGQIRIMMWSDYFPEKFVAGFKKSTGIKLMHIPYGSNEELLNRTRAAKGRGVDIVGPTAMRALQWKPLGLLLPFDMTKVPTDKILPAMLKGSTDQWTWEGKTYHLPYFWGTEGLAWRTDKWSSEYGTLSYGDLWTPEMKGKIMGRPHSLMLTIGLHMDATGALPSNRMLDAYKDEGNMRRIWTEITSFAVANKPQLKQFWNDAEAQKNGFMHNGVVLGQTWDGPPIALKNDGKPINYMAPREGALAWLDGLAIPRGARNMAQIYEFLKYIYSPRVGGLLASETGYNSVSKGADRYLTASAKKNFQEAYPEDALDRLWWWPPEPPWYAAARAEFRDKFVAA